MMTSKAVLSTSNMIHDKVGGELVIMAYLVKYKLYTVYMYIVFKY